MPSLTRKILILILVFILGAIGGVWAQAFLLPALASSGRFQDWEFVKDWNARTTIVRPVEEVVITESEGIERAVERAEHVVVAVESRSGNRVVTGSGLVATSDGLIVTLARVVPQGYGVMIYIRGDEDPVEAQVLKRDAEQDLALLQIDRKSLSTTSFAVSGDVKLGMSVFLLGKIFEQEGVTTIANTGIVKADSRNAVRTNIFEKFTLQGSTLFDLEGKAIGLNTIDEEGKVTTIPSPVIRAFSGL